ncbi:MAG: alkaline phosphatase D family protein [Pseudomonadota bacterium]
MTRWNWSRRTLLRASAATGLVGAVTPKLALAQTTVLRERIGLPYGVQTGDVSGDRAILWARADRPGRMMVEWSTTEGFRDPRQLHGPAALEDTDYTAKLDLTGLPADQTIFYRVSFTDLADVNVASEAVSGRLRTPPQAKRNVRFVWSGDTAGQGWGINPDFGGMRIYEAMRQVEPEFFIHSGDTIYADGPIAAEKEQPDGSVWKNVTTEEKSKVAETLREFRGNYAYNLMDDNVRAFNAEVSMFAQWDDHEVTNNWYPTEILADDRYKETSVALLAARGSRAFLEYMPVRPAGATETDRLYQSFGWGPSLDIFRIDMRSYRGPNTTNDQPEMSEVTALLGRAQLDWLKQALAASDATWKVIASDMPIGLLVRDGDANFENGANGDGPALGRELEFAELLTFIRDQNIQNVVWLTADVHYTAAHRYDPANAQYQAFAPFWEFVSGPLNAGTFGPNDLDNTFGPEVVYQNAPTAGEVNLPPSAGLQFFGQVDIDGESEIMTVTLKDLDGQILFTQELTPVV